MRERWGCDCDGVARRPHAYVGGSFGKYLDQIELITGRRPHTCPWRAQTDPLVRRVIELVPFADTGNLPAVLTEDSPALLFDAWMVFETARAATLIEIANLNRPRRP